MTEEQIFQIAKTCHEVNRTYCISIEDLSQLPWADAPDWQKESAFNGVKYHLANPKSTPKDSHVNWLKEKETNGWIYGKVKDVNAKTHPCIKEYHELPSYQQAKDHFFLTVVKSFIE